MIIMIKTTLYSVDIDGEQFY